MPSKSTLAGLALLTASASAFPPSYHHSPPGNHGSYGPGSGSASSHNQWRLANFTSLVAFGDSYTDDSRLGYFISHQGAPPPVGYDNPVSYHAADGGRTWVEYVKQYTGANLYNYAVSGAVCSNEITPRWFSAIDAPFPDIAGYELPAYLNDSALVYPNGTKFMEDPADATVYAIWIGTNDLGYAAIIQDEQVAGTNLTTYVGCVYDQLSRVYDNGGRFFVLMNVAPLNLAPEYGVAGEGGAGPNQYWEDKSGNITEISYRMLEEVVSVNAIYEYRTPYEVVLANRYPGASFAVYNVHDLMQNIHDDPSAYLNGTAPFNVTGHVNVCNATGGDCVANPNPDSFLWYDELHPSEQTERIIARTFVDVVKGVSVYATYWSS
ncbi:hypothetical protein B0A55_10897 [Friedmanniomyces simplex]|uniref:SGNH hydrolase-type esterase domain-containing protein n=1 Tax=Friedmanniomyces simplex TaxID=329884 RepID=A0A4U0WJ66_9PEZI|nr:hypothetical protein B0A55_10897 [Friedmanniomyces simplex]